MITTPTKISLENSFEKDRSLSAKAKRHMRVKGWTKKVDLFTRDLVIFPINEDNRHWYLVVAVRPGKAGGFLFVLNSFGGSREKALENISDYLKSEWKAKGVLGNFVAMKVVFPAPPQQKNFSDCGIFLIHYVHTLFRW